MILPCSKFWSHAPSAPLHSFIFARSGSSRSTSHLCINMMDLCKIITGESGKLFCSLILFLLIHRALAKVENRKVLTLKSLHPKGIHFSKKKLKLVGDPSNPRASPTLVQTKHAIMQLKRIWSAVSGTLQSTDNAIRISLPFFLL